jgi:hypothetical protein
MKYFFVKRRASSEVNPSFLSNLILWLDSADASTVILNGSDVSQINDKSGGSNHFHQPTVLNQSAYLLNDQNGKNTIELDGVDEFLYATTNFLTSITNTFYLVFQADQAGHPNAVILHHYNSVSFQGVISMYSDNNNTPNAKFQARDIASNVLSVDSATFTSDFMYTRYFYTTNLIGFGVNGAYNTASGAFTPPTFDTGASKMTIGVQSKWNDPANSAVQFPLTVTKGKFAELFAFSRQLTAPEISLMDSYVERKWAI